MTTIAITGVAGLLGRNLVAALSERGDVERILGLDVRAPEHVTSSVLAYRQADVRDGDLAEALAGVDALVHLASQTPSGPDAAAAGSVNVDGTRNVMEAAVTAGVTQVVYPSSVAVYGAHPDNDFPLTEDSPLRGTPDCDLAEHKLDVERWLEPWLDDHPDVAVAVLRFGWIAGEGIDSRLTRLFEQPRLPVVRGHRPPLQFLHLEDAVAAIVHAIDRRLRGGYNVCAEGWLSFDEVVAISGRRALELPEEVAFGVAERMWRLGLSEQPPGVVRHLMHPAVMSPTKLVDTGWSPSRSNRDAVADLAREHRDHVMLGGLRTERRTVRNVSLGAAGLAGLAAISASRRRSRRRLS